MPIRGTDIDVFTREQATTELGQMYDAAETTEILATTGARGIFVDEIAWKGTTYHVYVRAHQLSVNEPVSYTIRIRP